MKSRHMVLELCAFFLHLIFICDIIGIRNGCMMEGD